MLPRVQPIAPIRRTEPFDDSEWLFDVKYDGFRALTYLERGRCRLISPLIERWVQAVQALRSDPEARLPNSASSGRDRDD